RAARSCRSELIGRTRPRPPRTQAAGHRGARHGRHAPRQPGHPARGWLARVRSSSRVRHEGSALMLTFISYMVLGLAAGSVYSMTAFGTILVYRGSGVVNFAGGALATVGTFVYYDLVHQNHVPWPIAMVAGTL